MNLEEAVSLARRLRASAYPADENKIAAAVAIEDLVKMVRQRDMALDAYRKRDEADWKRQSNPGFKDDFDNEALNFLRTFWEEE